MTLAALKHALAESSESLPEAHIDSLMKAYDSLSTFPDVSPALKSLASDPSIDAYVFSNGTHAMVSSSVNSSPSLSPHASVFKALITVEEPQVFKPDPRVYKYLSERVRQANMGKIWLVSGNPFDVVGARSVGMQAAWVDRKGHHGNGGWTDQMGGLVGGVGPTIIVSGVEDAVEGIKKWMEENGDRMER